MVTGPVDDTPIEEIKEEAETETEAGQSPPQIPAPVRIDADF